MGAYIHDGFVDGWVGGYMVGVWMDGWVDGYMVGARILEIEWIGLRNNNAGSLSHTWHPLTNAQQL